MAPALTAGTPVTRNAHTNASVSAAGFGTHVAGDLLCVYGGTYAGLTTVTGGWSQLFADPANPEQFLYWKIAAGSSESVTFTGGSSNRWSVVPFKVTAGTFDAADPWDTVNHAQSGSSTTPDLPAVTPSDTADRVWLNGFAHASMSPPPTATQPSGHTLLAIASQDFLIAGLAYKGHAVGTATPFAEWSFNAANSYRSFSALLNPATATAVAARAMHHRKQQGMS